MSPNKKLLVAIVFSLLAGSTVMYFLKDSLTSVMISQEAKTYALKIRVDVIDNGFTFTMNPESPNVRVIYWATGGQILAAGEIWLDAKWQLNLGAEDKPTSSGAGDKCDVIIKLQAFADGTYKAEALLGGTYVKKVYFDNALELDMSTGARYSTWALPPLSA